MTIEQFIEKHSLSPVEIAWRPAVFLTGDRDDPARFDDRYEFYASPDRTIWVSINRTRNRFRVVYHDLLTVCSNWEIASGANYELAPLVTD